MTARAEDAERTRDRIIDAMLRRYAASPYDQVRVEDIAADAGVAAQTVLRRFGSKAGLMVAMVERELGRITAARAAIAGAGAATVIDALADHYEKYGTLIQKVYTDVGAVAGLEEVAMQGRAYHVGWCTAAFKSPGDGMADDARERRIAQIVALCDARTWSILRTESGLSARQTKHALHEMLAPFVGQG